MDLQEVKKEVRELPSIEHAVKQLQEQWIKPIRTNGNYRHSFLEKLDAKAEKELKQKLAQAQSLCNDIKSSQTIHDKLSQYSRYLVELKLSSFRGDGAKSKILTNQLLKDEYFSLSNTITEIKKNEQKVQALEKQYHEINTLLDKHLSLEETLFFMELPHLKYLHNLLKITQKQKVIIRNLGHHFISITQEKRNSR